MLDKDCFVPRNVGCLLFYGSSKEPFIMSFKPITRISVQLSFTQSSQRKETRRGRKILLNSINPSSDNFRPRQGQSKVKRCAFPYFTFKPDFATVFFNEFFHKQQSETISSLFGCAYGDCLLIDLK
jgi:hypothetical protein